MITLEDYLDFAEDLIDTDNGIEGKFELRFGTKITNEHREILAVKAGLFWCQGCKKWRRRRNKYLHLFAWCHWCATEAS